jgi:hypothetical protein
MEEWFYVKNNLKAREDIKEIIMHPIWSHFGLRKPKVEIDEACRSMPKGLQHSLLFYWNKRLSSGTCSLHDMAADRQLRNAERNHY